MADTSYLFVDGGALRATLERTSVACFDSDPITPSFWSIGAGHHKVFYYDALPARRPGEGDADYAARARPQRDIIDRIELLDRFHVYEGDARLRRRRQEQKKIDVMIAVDMLTHAFRRNMDRATLLTSDLDFKPLLDALVQAGTFVTLLYDPTHTNRELVLAADAREPMDLPTVHGWADASFQQRWPIPWRAQTTGRLGSAVELNTSAGVVQIARNDASTYRIAILNRAYHLAGPWSILQVYAREEFGFELPERPPQLAD